MNGNTTNQTNFNNNNATNSPRTYNANAWVDRLATLIHQQQQNNNNDNNKKPLKLFIAGDRSQVGKTSICLGLLGALINSGYSPNEIAYIKPATQCEQPQLISKYCELKGIACNGIGPLVFYSGFTRAFLNGETDNTETILKSIVNAVDEISKGKRFVVIDGVGYPAVGSICGCSNAVIAKRLEIPVLLVGKKGVGDAVDSFNLNASYFESHQVPVLGVVYNRLEKEGYYSLEKCKSAITKYFEQYGGKYNLYGFLPELKLSEQQSTSKSNNNNNATNGSSINNNKSNIIIEKNAQLFIDSFENNFEFGLLLKSIQNIEDNDNKTNNNNNHNDNIMMMQIDSNINNNNDKNNNNINTAVNGGVQTNFTGKRRTREMIQKEASGGGATGG